MTTVQTSKKADGTTDQTFTKADGTVVKVDSFDLSQFELSYRDVDHDTEVPLKLGTEPKEEKEAGGGDVSARIATKGIATRGGDVSVQYVGVIASFATIGAFAWTVMEDSKSSDTSALELHVLPPDSQRGWWATGQMTEVSWKEFKILNMFKKEHCKFTVSLSFCKDGKLNNGQPTPRGEWMTDLKTDIRVHNANWGTWLDGSSKILQTDGVPITNGKPQFQIETNVTVNIWGQKMHYKLLYHIHGHRVYKTDVTDPW